MGHKRQEDEQRQWEGGSVGSGIKIPLIIPDYIRRFPLCLAHTGFEQFYRMLTNV